MPTQTHIKQGGTISGPASSTDNAIVRWNGTTGKVIQSSTVIIDDSGNVTGANSFQLADNKYLYMGDSNESTMRYTTTNRFEHIVGGTTVRMFSANGNYQLALNSGGTFTSTGTTSPTVVSGGPYIFQGTAAPTANTSNYFSSFTVNGVASTDFNMAGFYGLYGALSYSRGGTINEESPLAFSVNHTGTGSVGTLGAEIVIINHSNASSTATLMVGDKYTFQGTAGTATEAVGLYVDFARTATTGKFSLIRGVVTGTAPTNTYLTELESDFVEGSTIKARATDESQDKFIPWFDSSTELEARLYFAT